MEQGSAGMERGCIGALVTSLMNDAQGGLKAMLGSVLRPFLPTSVNSGLPMNLAFIEAGVAGEGVEISSFS